MANYNAPWNKGLAGDERVKHSKETKRRMSVTHTGTTKSLYVRLKISAAQLGVPKPTSGVRGPKHHNWNPNRSAFQIYRRLVQNETEIIYRANKQVINPCDFPRRKAGTKGGYQLDHVVSVREGFEKKIPACEIARINNLQMLSWKANRSKGA